MTTKTFVSALLGASLVAAAALAGCDANRDDDSYARQEAPASDESSAGTTRDVPKRDSMTPSSMGEPADAMPGGTAAMMPGETTTLAGADVVGQPVLSQEGEEIGTIAKLVKDDNGESEFAVVEVGEFLGIGEKQVAIDVRHLSLTADGKVQSNVTADALQSMPEYQSDEYTDEPGEEDAE